MRFLPKVLLALLIGSSTIFAQPDSLGLQTDTLFVTADSMDLMTPMIEEINLGGQVYSAIITTEGDTLILADFKGVSVTAPREFASVEEKRKYYKFRRYATKVYPYAKEAIRIFKEVEYAKENLSRRKRKRELKRLEKELKAEFEEPLSKLTKLQGKIMIKMIEKEMRATMYDLIRSAKGRFAAFYWNNASKLYSYDLKEGYNYGQYKILDIVLQDYDISYDLPTSKTLKYIKISDLKN